MEGGKIIKRITPDYIYYMISEYQYVKKSLLYRFLKIAGLSKRERHKIIRNITSYSSIVYRKINDVEYFSHLNVDYNSSHENLEKCFLVLIDYFEHLDAHYFTNEFASITMSIDDDDYKIAYVDSSTENLCRLNLKADNCKYILVIENEILLEKFNEENVDCIVLITNNYNLDYFVKEK